jgi:hypothetical protein
MGGFATVCSAAARPKSGRSPGGSIWPERKRRLFRLRPFIRSAA